MADAFGAGDELFHLPFSDQALFRDGDHRKDVAFLAQAAEDPASRVLVLQERANVPVTDEGDLDWRAPTEVPGPRAEWIFLGLDAGGRALFAVDLPPGRLGTLRNAPLRDVGPTLEHEQCDAAIEAVALSTWHANHHFCARCGVATDAADGGHIRHCPACGADHFPRTDPAVIMLVSDGDRCVLGRRTGGVEGRWSTLAGFVEPGETPEAAVAREVHEEVGIAVTAVRYRGSQPWPFPSSLMLAYEARAEYAPLSINEEHHEVRWFTREEVADGLEHKTMTLPGPISAGHALIRSWLG